MGLEMMEPRATLYCWGEIPHGYTSKEFCLKFLEEGNMWMMPGTTYGKRGEEYVRISNVQPAERIAEAMARMKQFISVSN